MSIGETRAQLQAIPEKILDALGGLESLDTAIDEALAEVQMLTEGSQRESITNTLNAFAAMKQSSASIWADADTVYNNLREYAAIL